MKVVVRIHGSIKRAVSGKMTEVVLEDEARLRDLILNLGGEVEGSKEAFFGEYTIVDSSLIILVNGRNIYALDGLDTYLKDGDLITFIPPIVGG